MRLKTILTLVIAVASTTVMATNEPFEKLVLKNGSELEGFTSIQRPGEELVFSSSKALICLTKADVISVDCHDVPLNQLSERWKTWADKNDAYNGSGNSRTLSLCDIRTKDRVVSNVRLVSDGAIVQYLELSPDTYTLKWDSVRLVTRPKREKTLMSGLNYIVQYSGGVDIQGQCVEQVPGKTLSILNSKNIKEAINVSQINKQRIVPVNPGQSLFEQSPLTDELVLKNGSVVKGIITETSYGQNDADNHIVVTNESNMPQMVMIKDIVEYRKMENSKYKPLYDIMLQPGVILINRNRVYQTQVKEKIIGTNRILALQSDTCRFVLKADTLRAGITVEANLDFPLSEITFLPVTKYVSKKTTALGFTFEDLVKKTVAPSVSQVSINKTTKLVYLISKPGLYALYFRSAEKSVLLEVK